MVSFTTLCSNTDRHDHSINSLEALNFKILSDEVRKEANSLVLNNLTPSQAYKEFLLNLKKDCEDDLNFQLQKADGCKCPRRRNFNSLYIKYCQEHSAGKMAPKCFVVLKSE